MAYGDKRMGRKEAVGMEALMTQYIREMKISSGINQVRVTEAWNNASGASRYTLSVSYVGTYVYVTMNSSMARNQLYYQRDSIMQRMNDILAADTLFIGSAKGGNAVTNIILK